MDEKQAYKDYSVVLNYLLYCNSKDIPISDQMIDDLIHNFNNLRNIWLKHLINHLRSLHEIIKMYNLEHNQNLTSHINDFADHVNKMMHSIDQHIKQDSFLGYVQDVTKLWTSSVSKLQLIFNIINSEIGHEEASKIQETFKNEVVYIDDLDSI